MLFSYIIMGIQDRNLYTDTKGIKRCKFLGKKYPEECVGCSHHVSIFCGCDYEYYCGEGLGEIAT